MTRGEHDRIMAQCRAALLLPVVVFLVVMFSWAALAEEIIGQAEVIDGDTIKVAGQSIRLEGIDTHETADEPMGPAATRLLMQLTADREVKCDIETAGVYGRKIGVCRVKNRSGGWSAKSLNARMVRSGMAWVYPKTPYLYATEMIRAQGDCIGIWKEMVTTPWCWRKEN